MDQRRAGCEVVREHAQLIAHHVQVPDDIRVTLFGVGFILNSIILAVSKALNVDAHQFATI